MKKIKVKQLKEIDNSIKYHPILGTYYLNKCNRWKIELLLKKNIIWKFLSICLFVFNIVIIGYSNAIRIIKEDFSRDFVFVNQYLSDDLYFDKLQSILNRR